MVAEDAEIDGYLFPAGTMVVVNTAAANRDPAIYDDPDRVDITREGAPAILTFGGGVHYCLGANLARREIAEALNVLDPAVAEPAHRRTGAMEADGDPERADESAHRVRPHRLGSRADAKVPQNGTF